MTVLSYQQVLESLYGLERGGGALGLRGIELLLHGMGHPQESFQAVHVAGTNGKGSVCAFTERILRAAGFRTGLFTSPHLVDYRERIRLSGRMVGAAELAELLAEVRCLSDAPGRTFFEITTALGFSHFARSGVEWAVVEVGLGGRLDCTNVLKPRVCAVTEIGLDHMDQLGRRLEDVAREKAGIVKPGVPVVSAVGKRLPAMVVARAAREQKAPWVPVGSALAARRVRLDWEGADFVVSGGPDGDLPVRISLRGAHQVRHALTAATLAAELRRDGVPIAASHVAEGLAATRWPGRFEPCPREPRLWWDGAHNPDGTRGLARSWRRLKLPAPGAFLFACSRDKPVAGMLRALAALAPQATLYATKSSSERTLDPAEIAARAEGLGLRARASPSLSEALDSALEPGRRPVLLCGSLFLVGDAMRLLGCPPPEVL